MENIVILGSTGSIGTSTLNVLRNTERYRLVGISFNENIDLARKQIREFLPDCVCCMKDEHKGILESEFPWLKVFVGSDGLCRMIDVCDVVVNALVGSAGILPSYVAVDRGKRLLLANKESLVVAGGIIGALADSRGVDIIPIDSEHSAVYQCLRGNRRRDLRRVILTASGGPFIDRKDFSGITPEEALRHPNWNMGRKITIDSATLMNKGFEVMEAYWLFKLNRDQISVVIHRQSVVHSAVEFVDGSIIAQMAPPDMRIPIAYALFGPDRVETGLALELEEIGTLTFERPDFGRFPTLGLAYRALEHPDRNTGLILNAADEVVVEEFVGGNLEFNRIFEVLQKSVEVFDDTLPGDIHGILRETELVKSEVRKIIRDGG